MNAVAKRPLRRWLVTFVPAPKITQMPSSIIISTLEISAGSFRNVSTTRAMST